VNVPNVGAQPNFNRNPSFSQPHVNPQQVAPRNVPGTQINPGANVGAGLRGNSNVQPHIGRNAPGGVPRTNVGANAGGNITNNANINPGAHLQNQAGIRANAGVNNPALQGNAALRGQLNAQNGLNANRHNLGGNTVVLNNRTVNLSNSGYRPAYNRHPQYMGYWNSPNGYGGFGNGFMTGLGFGLGQGLTGWGYGYGYPYGYGYGYRPLGWGYGAWGLGSLGYGSGYLGYYNPYYVNNYGTYGNYSYAQPIPVAYSSQPLVSGGANNCEQALNDAAAAFKQNDYDMALDILNRGVAQCPDDSVMHEFRALVFFAKGDYQQAAATIHSVLAVGPGWNWSTLSNLYGSVGTYTTQLRALEAFTISNPQDSASRFLLAYHYMVEGYPDATERQLRAVVQLTPNDRVATDLLRMVTKPSPEASDPNQLPTPQPPAAAPGAAAVVPNSPIPSPNNPGPAPANNKPAFDPAMLIGTWHASRPDGSKFELVFDTNSTFRWKFTMKEQSNEFGGKYSVEGNVVTLERNEGGSLIAGIVPSNDHAMNFKLIGAPAEDPGLDFQK
jgi:tetratricopeptide (TPR) repeat protein